MTVTQLGLVVHPRRDIAGALDTIADWASQHGVAVGQVPVPEQGRQVAEPVEAESCDLVVAVGGDGTTLAGLHAAAPAAVPVFGVACGSIGVLTAVSADELVAGLEQVAAGRWTPRRLPGLEIVAADGPLGVAINDFAVIRDGIGQVIVEISVDGERYARLAGDGVIVAGRLGSSAYTMAAGGPILAPGTEGLVVTPLGHHGGVAPPLVVGPAGRVSLTVEPGYGGARCELDGQELPTDATVIDVSQRADYATLVELHDSEPAIAGLRRRGLIVDSPRILARDARDGRLLDPPSGG
jgi:NAD+ kinase